MLWEKLTSNVLSEKDRKFLIIRDSEMWCLWYLTEHQTGSWWSMIAASEDLVKLKKCAEGNKHVFTNR